MFVKASLQTSNLSIHIQRSFTDLDFADDVRLLAELLGLLVPALEAFVTEVSKDLGLEYLGPEVN